MLGRDLDRARDAMASLALWGPGPGRLSHLGADRQPVHPAGSLVGRRSPLVAWDLMARLPAGLVGHERLPGTLDRNQGHLAHKSDLDRRDPESPRRIPPRVAGFRPLDTHDGACSSSHPSFNAPKSRTGTPRRGVPFVSLRYGRLLMRVSACGLTGVADERRRQAVRLGTGQRWIRHEL